MVNWTNPGNTPFEMLTNDYKQLKADNKIYTKTLYIRYIRQLQWFFTGAIK